MNKRKRLISISGTKTNSVHLKFSTSLSMEEQSQDLSLLLLQDFAELMDLLILYNKRLFEYLLQFYVHFLQISL